MSKITNDGLTRLTCSCTHRLSALMDSDLAWINGKSARQSWCYADAFKRSIISGAIYHFTHMTTGASKGSMDWRIRFSQLFRLPVIIIHSWVDWRQTLFATDQMSSMLNTSGSGSPNMSSNFTCHTA